MQHYVELEDMVHMAIKVEQQPKRGSGTRAGHNSSSTSWKSSHAKPLDKSQMPKPVPNSATTSHVPHSKSMSKQASHGVASQWGNCDRL
jgi:hypothetical protein